MNLEIESKKSLRLYISNADETEILGSVIGNAVDCGITIALYGEMGAGKTTVTKGIAKGLGVDDIVHSPTFNLLHEHNGRLNLYHFDVYRLRNSYEMDDLGYEEYFYGDGVTVIEWPDIIADILPQDRLELKFSINGDTRILDISSTGPNSSLIIDDISRDRFVLSLIC